jgi:hypothetical protein
MDNIIENLSDVPNPLPIKNVISKEIHPPRMWWNDPWFQEWLRMARDGHELIFYK